MKKTALHTPLRCHLLAALSEAERERLYPHLRLVPMPVGKALYESGELRLLSLDRLPSDNLVMTQELIANMLGVRREGVTEAAGKLQKLGVIRYVRGHITVIDRPTREQRCCECYPVEKRESDRIEHMAAGRGLTRLRASRYRPGTGPRPGIFSCPSIFLTARDRVQLKFLVPLQRLSRVGPAAVIVVLTIPGLTITIRGLHEDMRWRRVVYRHRGHRAYAGGGGTFRA